MKHKAKWILFILTLILSITSLFAWFNLSNVYPIEVKPGLFDGAMNFYLNDILIDETSIYYDAINNRLILDGHDDTKDNYIGYLKVDLSITVHNTSRFRVRILDEWALTRSYTNGQVITNIVPNFNFIEGMPVYPYFVHHDFSMIYQDIHYYYNHLILPQTLTETPFIIGANPYPVRTTINYVETVVVYFSIQLDIVQANRYQEVWGVELYVDTKRRYL